MGYMAQTSMPEAITPRPRRRVAVHDEPGLVLGRRAGSLKRRSRFSSAHSQPASSSRWLARPRSRPSSRRWWPPAPGPAAGPGCRSCRAAQHEHVLAAPRIDAASGTRPPSESRTRGIRPRPARRGPGVRFRDDPDPDPFRHLLSSRMMQPGFSSSASQPAQQHLLVEGHHQVGLVAAVGDRRPAPRGCGCRWPPRCCAPGAGSRRG